MNDSTFEQEERYLSYLESLNSRTGLRWDISPVKREVCFETQTAISGWDATASVYEYQMDEETIWICNVCIYCPHSGRISRSGLNPLSAFRNTLRLASIVMDWDEYKNRNHHGEEAKDQ